tara:strand:+ start:259 stop:708 length:450 start_codon:yes stop_codon:yes gene_type:complete
MKPTKEKFLAELSKQKPTKINLALVDELNTLVDEMKSFDLENKFDVVFTEYENALGLMNQAINAADKYVPLASDFEAAAYEQWEVYQQAQEKYFEITNQLQDLGIAESPHLTDLFREIANGEQIGMKAFDQTQSEFSEHNELVDISNFN